MPSSGTTGQTTFEVSELMDHIARRCGLSPSMLSAEVSSTIRNGIFFFLSGLSNRGINLWKVQRTLLPLYTGQAEYTLEAGTIDVISALFRNPSRLSGTVTSSTSLSSGVVGNLSDGDIATSATQSSPGGNFSWDFSVEKTVNMVGILPASNSTLDLVFETSQNGTSWSSIMAVGSASFTAGVWRWYELEPSRKARYFRIRETSTGVLSFSEVYLSESWNEIPMYRMNRDEYIAIGNKRSLSETPLQYWVDRQLTPKIVLWPVPSNTFKVVSLFVHRHIEDVGAMSNTLDIPQRWYEALVANVAFQILLDIPGADLNRYNLLKEQAAKAMAEAEAEERDATPVRWRPNISPYTR